MKVAARFDSLDLAALDDAQLQAEYMTLRQASIKHFQLIRYGMVTHSIGTNLMVKRWLMDWLDDRSGLLYSKLISGLEDNKTIKTNIAIAKLARAAQKDEAVRERLITSSSQDVLDALAADPRMRSFGQDLEAFLKEYGHRSHTREMYFPRWADDPTLVIDVCAPSCPPSGDLELERRIGKEGDGRRSEIARLQATTSQDGVPPGVALRLDVPNVQENQRFYWTT